MFLFSHPQSISIRVRQTLSGQETRRKIHKTPLFTQVVLLVIASVCICLQMAQAQVTKQWDRRFGGSSHDRLYHSIPTSDGGYLLAGRSISDISGDKSEAGRGEEDYWVVKISGSGGKQWDKRFGTTTNDKLETVIQTADGGYLLGGYTDIGISGDKSETSRGGNDYWIVKINASGIKLWDKRFGGTGSDLLYSIAPTSDGGFLLGGTSGSDANGDKSETSRGGNDYWIVKINASGIKLWDKRFGTSDSDDLASVIPTSDGGFLLAGNSFSGINGDRSEDSRGSDDYWILKITTEGVKQWDKRFGGDGYDDLTSVTQTLDGGYLLGGDSNSVISGDKSEEGHFDDYWVVKISSTGIKQWDRTLGNTDGSREPVVIQSTDGGYLVAGIGDDTFATGGIYYQIVKLNSSGTTQWIKYFGGTYFSGDSQHSTYLMSAFQITDGGYFLAGYTALDVEGDISQPGRRGDDYWILKTYPELPALGYCLPGYQFECSSGDYINNFSINTLVNNASTCYGQENNYIYYEPNPFNPTTQLLKGQSYTISVQAGTRKQGFGVWIDYNDDKDFADAGEFVYSSPTAGTGVFTGTVTVPAGVSTGKRRMRVRSKYNATVAATESCTSFTYGETEDYTITIGYCLPSYLASCATDYINNFSFNTLVNNNTNCNGQIDNYTNYTPTGSYTTTVTKGQSYLLSMQPGGGFAQGFGVWIDYNDDKDFADAGEFVYSSPTAGTGVFSSNIIIPAGISSGQKRLRVRNRYNGLVTSVDFCNTFNLGETEDYTITVIDPVIASSQWNKRFGGSATDNFSIVIKTSDGGYLLGGHSLSGITGDKTQASQGARDFWIVKTDVLGNKIWDKRFGGTADEYFNTAIQTTDGGYLLGGSSLSDISGDKSEASRGGQDYWVIKITATGVKQWDKRFGGTGTDDLRTLIQTAAGYYFVAGYSNSPASGDKSQGTQGGQDYWVVKLTATGAKIWDKRFGGTVDDLLEGVAQTADGGYILGGRSASGISGDKTQASQGGRDYWLVRIDGAGNKIWDKRFGGTGDDDLYALGKTAAGFFYIGGYSTSVAGGDKSQGNQGGKDYWMLKITPEGAKIWDKRFGGTADDELYSAIQTTDGGYLIGGKSLSGISGDKTQDSRGGSDYWVVKTDGNGNKLWDKRFGGTAAEDLRRVIQTTDGGYLLGGRSDSGIGADRSQGSQGGTDYWLVKLSASGGASPEARIAAKQTEKGADNLILTANPNPFTEKLRVGFILQQTEQVNLKIYDSQGREVRQLYQGEAEGGQLYEFDFVSQGHKAGMYIIRLGTSSNIHTKKIVLIR